MVRYVPALLPTDSAIVRALRSAQHAHRESPADPRPLVLVTSTRTDENGAPVVVGRRMERAELPRSFRPTGTDRSEGREVRASARAVAVRADAMRHARAVLGILGPGEEGPEPCAASVLSSLDDPATVGALRVLAVAGMRCVVARANARGEVATTFRPVDAFGREVSDAIGSLWLSHATDAWRNGAPTTATGVVAYLRTIVRRQSRMIEPRARKGGPAAPLPLVSAADVAGAGGIEALLDAEEAARALDKALERLSPAEGEAIRAAASARVSGERVRTDGTTRRALAKIAADVDNIEP